MKEEIKEQTLNERQKKTKKQDKRTQCESMGGGGGLKNYG